MTIETPREAALDREEEFDRAETGVRFLIVLLFFVISRLVEALFALLALFCLGFALVTKRRPGDAVQRFALRLIRYIVEIGRYLAYYDDDPPFPFRDLPPEPEREERDARAVG
jgi:hypothetical protein